MALADAGAEVGLWASDQSAARRRRYYLPDHLCNALSARRQKLWTASANLIFCMITESGYRITTALRCLQKIVALRRVVSTRGMLERWALSHKRFKKKLAWWVYQQHDLKQRVAISQLARRKPEACICSGLEFP